MKVIPTSNNRIGLYVWQLGRNLLHDKRNLKRMIKKNAPPSIIEYAKWAVVESHNAFQIAKQHFAEDISK